MSIVLRIVLIVVSLITLIGIIRKIRNAKVQIEHSLFWIVFSVVLLIISIFPVIAEFFAELLGIQSTVNFIFLVIIFILLIHQFYATIHMSQLENKLRTLVQELAVRDAQKKDKKEE